jgi:hypothetical protein
VEELRMQPATIFGEMMREILQDYHTHIACGYFEGAMYVKPMLYSTSRSASFVVKPFGSYKHLRKEYLVFRSYDGLLWEFHEIPF